MLLALEFPPLSHITHWPDFALKNTPFGMNKIFLIYALAELFTFLIFTLGNKKKMVPTGMQNVAEMSVEFIEDGIVKETMGPEGKKYVPILTAFFFFIFFTNIFEIIPVFQMPASARVALPLVLALLAFLIYTVAGIFSHGPIGFLKHMLVPLAKPLDRLVKSSSDRVRALSPS